MKKWMLGALFFCSLNLYAQDVATTLKDAQNLDRQLKETEALAKYESVLQADAGNLPALFRIVELQCSLGDKQKTEDAKRPFFAKALSVAKDALKAHPNTAEANYLMALASGKMTEVAEENKQVVAYVRDVKDYADKALAINPNYGKANYILGKWHLQMIQLNWAKKAAVKAIYGGLPKASLEESIRYLELARKQDMYFTNIYLDLAKAYEEDRKVVKTTEMLNLLAKMPVRNANDATVKAEGKTMLARYQ